MKLDVHTCYKHTTFRNSFFTFESHIKSRTLDMDKFQQMLDPSKSRIVEKSKRSMVVQFFEDTRVWYMVVSSFGSVCFFDCEDHIQKQLKQLSEITTTQPYKYDST
jgi:hypothetical protein